MSPPSHWLLQSYSSSGSTFGTLKSQLKDLFLYCSSTKLGFLSFHFVLFLRRNKMDKEMCFEAVSQMSIYRVPASWGNKLGLGITGKMTVKSFPIDFPRVPHCSLMATVEDSPKGQKHFVKDFWISKAWFGLSMNITETMVFHSYLEKCTLLLPNFSRGTGVLLILQVKFIAMLPGFYHKQQE